MFVIFFTQEIDKLKQIILIILFLYIYIIHIYVKYNYIFFRIMRIQNLFKTRIFKKLFDFKFKIIKVY